MHSLITSRLAIVGYAALALSLPTVARAEPGPQHLRIEIIRPEIPIPANGAVLLVGAIPDGIPIVTVTRVDPPLQVPGVISPLFEGSDSWWTWTPEGAIQPGTYDVTAQPHPESAVARASITFTEAIALEKPALEVTPTLTEEVSTLSNNCCADGDVGLAAPCVGDVTLRTLIVNVAIFSSAPEVAQHQFVFGVSTAEHAGEAGHVSPIQMTPGSATLFYDEQVDAYCYAVQAIELATKTVHTYPELEPRCVTQGSIGPAGYEPFEIPDDVLDRTLCPTPPRVVADAWCEANASACEGLEPMAAAANGCRYYDYACNAGPFPQDDVGSHGGASGAAGAGGTAGAGGSVPEPQPMAVAGAAAATPSKQSAGGCNTVATERGSPSSLASPGPAALGLALALFTIGARRRARAR